MNRDELIDLCDRYVRRRGLGTLHVSPDTMPPVLEIVEGFLHAEISESEKNSLLAYVRGPEHDGDDDVGFGDEAMMPAELDEAIPAELDEAILANTDDSGD